MYTSWLEMAEFHMFDKTSMISSTCGPRSSSSYIRLCAQQTVYDSNFIEYGKWLEYSFRKP